MLETLFRLYLAHAVCDYGLQTKWHVTQKYKHLHFLLGHCLIQAAGVYVVLGFRAAVAELLLHAIVDGLKIRGCISDTADQLLHYLYKPLLIAL